MNLKIETLGESQLREITKDQAESIMAVSPTYTLTQSTDGRCQLYALQGCVRIMKMTSEGREVFILFQKEGS